MPFNCYSQDERIITIVEYNVENLFYKGHKTNKDSKEYYRYWKKIKSIGKVMGEVVNTTPDIIGLVEVEKDSCIYDLVKRSPLRQLKYDYIITHSPDHRGINVALLYRKKRFRPFAKQAIRLQNLQTRDILLVSGKTITGDTLDIFLTHYPSRRGGKRKSQHKRIEASSYIIGALDSLKQIRDKKNFIIMGDFNDTASQPSLKMLLDYGLIDIIEKDARERKIGTYYSQCRWEILDHFFISSNLLLQTSHPHIIPEGTRILYHPYLLEEDKKFRRLKPRRYKVGPRYIGGISDHLPIVLLLQLM